METMTLNRFEGIIWLMTVHFFIGITQGQSNATATPAGFNLNCGNEKVEMFSAFDVRLGGGSVPATLAVSTTETIALPNDALDRPVCGGVTPGGKGYWFPVSSETQGKVDLLFCTLTKTPLTIIPTVYQAPPEHAVEETNCEDMTCTAIGSKHPLQSEKIQSEGDLCPNATNVGGVHFTASKNQIYYVHVDVTTDLVELEGFEAISHVTESRSDSLASGVSTVMAMLLVGWLQC
ncbi:hypothetical protein FisN_11Lh294 [Fistulifera solaris]|uniref:Uncharacterized protein n=1 Tax=Fistulifera solaris TaxID=1519565 RepID=A0A1Z5K0L1_FISSO|nr:hypothetical protein FisN_11Lh294 [Fistulifera solaris]|eukprot:GAX19834.1 hypothetical protein FisN_11Lh294 [Fistulifera solaris]